jgi:hypothetical protein
MDFSNMITKALASIDGLLMEKNNPYRVPKGPKGGQFTSRNGVGGGAASEGGKVSGGSGGGSGAVKAKPTMSAAESAKMKAELDAAGGPKRNMDKGKVSGAYHSDNAITDPFYKRDSSDNGIYYSGHWDKSEKPPKGYGADMPKAPRTPTVKEGDFTSKGVWKPPMSMKDIDNLRNQGEAGVFAARVMMNDLYAHATKRQGSEVEKHKFESQGQKKYMKDKGLSTMNWEWHHKISGGKGGSNSGKNMSLLNGGEHTVAHMLEAVINPTKGTKGGTKPGNLGVYPRIELATAARAQNNITKQLGSQAGKLRNAKYGKDGSAPMSASDFKKLEARINQQVKPYMNIAIKAGIYKKGSKLRFDKKGVVYQINNAINELRGYLVNNPIQPIK